MLQAITTKFLGPTNVRGSRYKATAQGGSVTVGADDRLNPDQNHMRAAKALCEKLGWTPDQGRGYAGTWVAGGTGDGCVFVFTGEGDQPGGWPAGSAFTFER